MRSHWEATQRHCAAPILLYSILQHGPSEALRFSTLAHVECRPERLGVCGERATHPKGTEDQHKRSKRVFDRLGCVSVLDN